MSDQMAMDQPRPDVFRFLDLAPELRNRIYECALIEDSGFVAVRRSAYPPERYLKKMLEEPGLLHVCRQIHTKSLAVFYGENVFVFQYYDWAFAFLRRLPSFKIRMLRRFRCSWVPFSFELVRNRLHETRSNFQSAGLRVDIHQCQVKVEGERLVWMSSANVEQFEGKVVGHGRVTVRKAFGDAKQEKE